MGISDECTVTFRTPNFDLPRLSQCTPEFKSGLNDLIRTSLSWCGCLIKKYTTTSHTRPSDRGTYSWPQWRPDKRPVHGCYQPQQCTGRYHQLCIYKNTIKQLSVPLITYSHTIIALTKRYLKTAFRCVNETTGWCFILARFILNLISSSGRLCESLVMFTVTYKTEIYIYQPYRIHWSNRLQGI